MVERCADMKANFDPKKGLSVYTPEQALAQARKLRIHDYLLAVAKAGAKRNLMGVAVADIPEIMLSIGVQSYPDGTEIWFALEGEGAQQAGKLFLAMWSSFTGPTSTRKVDMVDPKNN